MSVEIITDADKLTALLSGEIDHHNCRKIRKDIDELIISSKPKTLTFDFKDVSFMDSSGIGLVMGRYKLLSEYGGKIQITNTAPYIKKVLKVSGIEAIADLNSKEEEEK